MSRVRFALVGCGAIAKKHAHALHNHVDDAEIGAFVDRDLARAQQLGQQYNAPAYGSVADLMQSPDAANIGAFSVLTPSGSHAPLTIELAQYGRPIVVEKPMALRLEDADRMIEACDAHGVKLFVVHQNRYNPPIVA